jgi:hypothetical protein
MAAVLEGKHLLRVHTYRTPHSEKSLSNIHASNDIRTQDPIVRVGQYHGCLNVNMATHPFFAQHSACILPSVKLRRTSLLTDAITDIMATCPELLASKETRRCFLFQTQHCRQVVGFSVTLFKSFACLHIAPS